MNNPSEEFDWFGPDAATFGDRLAGAREVAGMTQAELAKRLGVRLTTLQAWEDDQSDPRANRLQMLTGLLNVSLTWLLAGTGEGPDEPATEVEVDADIDALLFEMRSIKTDLAKAGDRLARLEKRLRQRLKA